MFATSSIIANRNATSARQNQIVKTANCSYGGIHCSLVGAVGLHPFSKLKTSCAACSISGAPPMATILLTCLIFCNTITAQDCNVRLTKNEITSFGCIKLLCTRNMPRSAVPKEAITAMQSTRKSLCFPTKFSPHIPNNSSPFLGTVQKEKAELSTLHTAAERS